MDETLKSSVIDAVIDLARTIRNDVHTEPKYGGTVFMTAPEASALVAGVFGSKNHVSVEFSQGATFDDPDGVLEGKGKARRHVKLLALGDIASKDVAGFLAQALK